MNEILSTVLPLLALVALFAGLALWARRDAFTAPSSAYVAEDVDTALRDLTPVAPQRTRKPVGADRRPARNESHATTATA